MLTYAIAVARSGGVVPTSALTLLRNRSPAELPFHACQHLFWTNPSGSVAFAGWQDTLDDCGIGSRWHHTPDRVTAFTGWMWPRGRPWPGDRPWAAQLAEHLSTHPLEQGTDGFLGVFTALSLGRDGRGAVASDPLGIGLMYMAEGPELTVLSSRANLAARLLTAKSTASPPRDTLGTCWLAYSPYPIGTRTSFEGVEVAPAGAAAEIDPAYGIRLRRTAVPPWRGRPPSDEREALVGELRADIATSIRAALNLRVGRHLANLTGGKDSRLVLAVLLDEGLADEFEFRTWGSADLPDVLIARQIAATFGLRHEVRRTDEDLRESRAARAAALRDAGYGEVPRREMVFRVTAGSWFGMRNVSEPGSASPPRGERVLLSGLFGETLRTNFPQTGWLKSMPQLEAFPREGLGFGSAGILRPEAKAYYDEEARRAVLDEFTEGDGPQDAVDAFYIRHRLRRWSGTGLEIDQRNRVFPLYSHAGLRAAFGIGAQDRHAEWIHFEIMHRACEPLARLPFDKGGWDKRLHSGSSSPDPQAEAAPAPSGPARPSVQSVPPSDSRQRTGRGPRTRTVRRDRRQKAESTDLEIMRRYLLDDRSNPVFDIVDPDATAAVLDRFTELRDSTKLQLFGALTAAMWLGGSGITIQADPS
jgi:hypothetical protein